MSLQKLLMNLYQYRRRTFPNLRLFLSRHFEYRPLDGVQASSNESFIDLSSIFISFHCQLPLIALIFYAPSTFHAIFSVLWYIWHSWCPWWMFISPYWIFSLHDKEFESTWKLREIIFITAEKSIRVNSLWNVVQYRQSVMFMYINNNNMDESMMCPIEVNRIISNKHLKQR